MPISFRKEEEEYRKDWLPDDLGERLITIRDRVRQIHDRCKNFPQLRWFTPHGKEHYKAVEDLIHRLVPEDRHINLTEMEKFFLLGAAWLHDLGMIKGLFADDTILEDNYIRDQHHTRSERFIGNNYRECGLEEYEAPIFGLLARFHRRRCPINDCPELIPVATGGAIRLRLLASYLRLADSLHIDHTRSPGDQYAISLTYDIPSASKLHWIRSKFVLGVDIHADKHKIVVHMKKPIPSSLFQERDKIEKEQSETRKEEVDWELQRKRRDVDQLLNGIYDIVINDLNSELDSIKDVLIDADISHYLRVTRELHEIEIDEQLHRDINSVVKYYYLIDNPSSSSLLNLVIDAIKSILKAHSCQTWGHDNKGNSREISSVAYEALDQFLRDVEKGVLESRRCHTGLQKLVDVAREILKDGNFVAIEKWADEQLDNLGKNRKYVRYHATRFFSEQLEKKHKEALDVFLDRLFVSDHSTGKDFKQIDVLLYGYSELVIKSLCGFRDAVVLKLLKKYHDVWEKTLTTEDWREENIRSIHPIHRFELEKKASRFFRIFVCEAQPKNRTAYGGRLVFHDGLLYCTTLTDTGFENIYLIPDAIAASLLSPDDHEEKMRCQDTSPYIDYVMVGANGFDDKYFRHSAGHAMVISLATSRNDRSNESNPNESNPNESTGSSERPLVVLAVTTNKYDDPVESSSADKAQNQEKNRNNSDVEIREGWRFRRPFGKEQLRYNVFVSQDPGLREKLENLPILFYNPREDRIPIDRVNVVIAEGGYKECEEGEILSGKDIKKELSIKESE